MQELPCFPDRRGSDKGEVADFRRESVKPLHRLFGIIGVRENYGRGPEKILNGPLVSGDCHCGVARQEI
jgi:hypothetical protein